MVRNEKWILTGGVYYLNKQYTRVAAGVATNALLMSRLMRCWCHNWHLLWHRARFEWCLNRSCCHSRNFYDVEKEKLPEHYCRSGRQLFTQRGWICVKQDRGLRLPLLPNKRLIVTLKCLLTLPLNPFVLYHCVSTPKRFCVKKKRENIDCNTVFVAKHLTASFWRSAGIDRSCWWLPPAPLFVMYSRRSLDLCSSLFFYPWRQHPE